MLFDISATVSQIGNDAMVHMGTIVLFFAAYLIATILVISMRCRQRTALRRAIMARQIGGTPTMPLPPECVLERVRKRVSAEAQTCSEKRQFGRREAA